MIATTAGRRRAVPATCASSVRASSPVHHRARFVIRLARVSVKAVRFLPKPPKERPWKMTRSPGGLFLARTIAGDPRSHAVSIVLGATWHAGLLRPLRRLACLR